MVVFLLICLSLFKLLCLVEDLVVSELALVGEVHDVRADLAEASRVSDDAQLDTYRCL